MGSVIDFKPRVNQQPAAPAQPAQASGSEFAAVARVLPFAAPVLRDMEEQGAAMQVLAALMFYAHQGHDDGKRARRAVVAMQELLSGGPAAD